MAKDIRDTVLYDRALGCLVAGFIGDAMGAPTESKDYRYIEEHFGWVDDFAGGGTDDTAVKHLLAEALIRSEGYATMDDWAQVWLENWDLVTHVNATISYNSRKLRLRMLPVTVGAGSMPTSTAPMCMSPVGIVNACNPREAFRQAWELAGLINAQETSYCRDGAAVMAAAVAEAFRPEATVDSVIEASARYLPPVSGRAMADSIARAMDLVSSTPDYKTLRRKAYDEPTQVPLLAEFQNNPFETVPLTLALFRLADGDVEEMVIYGANFGRDADTVASMGGAIAGALRGAASIRADWLGRVRSSDTLDQEKLAEKLAAIALGKVEREAAAHSDLQAVAS